MSMFSRVRFHFFFVAWNIHTVIFFHFLFSGYFCSVFVCATCIVSGGWNPSSSAFLNVFFESLNRCIDALFYTGENSSPFSWKVSLERHLWNVRPYLHDYLFFGPFVDVLPSPTSLMVLSIWQVDSIGIYPFDEIYAI